MPTVFKWLAIWARYSSFVVVVLVIEVLLKYATPAAHMRVDVVSPRPACSRSDLDDESSSQTPGACQLSHAADMGESPWYEYRHRE